MANGTAPGPGVPQQPLPGWLGSAVQITTQVGVPTVFAGVLLYFVLTNVTGTLSQMKKNDEDRMRMLAAMQDTLVGALTNQSQIFERATNNQTEKFVNAINANIATNTGIAKSMEELVRQEHSYERDRRRKDGKE